MMRNSATRAVSPKPPYTRAYASSAPLALSSVGQSGACAASSTRTDSSRTVMSTRSRLLPSTTKRQLSSRLIVESASPQKSAARRRTSSR